MGDQYCVVIPALNAARTIGNIVKRITHLKMPVVVVNDGSCDETASIASANGAFVISHLRNEGKGAAIRTGFEYALRAGFNGVVTMDSDGQHDPDEITQLIHAGEVQHAGIVLGNRMRNEINMPIVRRVTNRLMSNVVSLIARQVLPDTQCGFRFIRKEVLQSVVLRARRFEIETELLLAAAAKRWKIISVPVRTTYREHQSYIRPLRDTVRFMALVLWYMIKR